MPHTIRFRSLRRAAGVSLLLAAAAAPAAEGWSPAGANDWSCQPGAAHPRPVVLVHGTFANMAFNWAVLSPRLKAAGYCVYALNYGANSATALSGNQMHGVGPIEASAAELSAFVDRVLAATGKTQVDIVGHSQGGMMPRYYLQFLAGAPKVNHLIGIAPDSHGTTVSGLSGLAQAFPWVTQPLLESWCQSCTQQLKGSSFMNLLNSSGDTISGVRYTVISTKYDRVATPYTSQALSGPDVTNIVLQDQCAFNVSDHVSVAVDPLVARNVLNALDPANAVRPSCFSW